MNLPKVVIWNRSKYESFTDALEAGAVYGNSVANEALDQYLSGDSTTDLENMLRMFEDSMESVNNSDHVFEIQYGDSDTMSLYEYLNQ